MLGIKAEKLNDEELTKYCKNTLFENEKIKVSKTNQDYDFVAFVENKTEEDILITFPETDDFFGEEFSVSANDWIGILAIEETPNLLQAFEQGDFNILNV